MRCPICETETETPQVRVLDPVLGVCGAQCPDCKARIILEVTVIRAIRQ